jgi:hypothetical protein
LVTATGNIVTGANLIATGYASITGNVTGNYFIGNGSQLTGVTASAVNANALLGNTLSSNVLFSSLTTVGTLTSLSVSGNVVGGNVSTAGLITATGNINSGANITATANITAVNYFATGFVTASGNVTGGNLVAGNQVTATGNITGGNLITAGVATVTGNINSGANIVATANVIGGNISTAGLITATGNIVSGANAVVSGYATVTGNITGGNLITAGLATVTGNITGGNLTTPNTATLGNIIISGQNINDNVANGRININSNLSNVDFGVSGQAANIFYVSASSNTVSFGNATQTTNALVAFNTSTSVLMPVGNTAQRPSAGVTGMLRFNTTVNSFEVYNGGSWANVGAPQFTVVADEQFSGDGTTTVYTLGSAQTTNSCIVSINGVIQIPTLAYAVTANTTLTFTEAPAVGDVIDVREITTTTSVTSISNSSGNAVITANASSAVVNVTGALSATGNVTGNYLLGNGALLTGVITSVANINSGTSNVTVVSSGGNVTVGVGGTANVVQWATTGEYVTGVVSASGNITGGNLSVSTGTVTLGSIVNANANGAGNIGSATTYFNTVFAKATSAQYADLAEKYTADAEYTPGTVVSFGGSEEVTISDVAGDTRVAGVVSTNPSYIMNSGLDSEYVVTVALTGRVPTKVCGFIKKGDLMVSAGNGHAMAEANPKVGTVIGKALEDWNGGNGVIEVVVGRF